MKIIGMDLANAIMDQLADAKSKRLMLFDVREVSTITDYVIIAEGTSQTHVKGIADRVVKHFKNQEIQGDAEGYQEGSWVLLDYDTVIVHVFHPETRQYYKIEELFKPYLIQSREND
ncbi:MAG: ribosome silencing factor [SAR324 cluster bacterium]|nr:ribosome silencing factor [SAR324 cluster bacterium]MBF0349473.1 ribosome silencing factor [SAR324 cluster bacterium]